MSQAYFPLGQNLARTIAFVDSHLQPICLYSMTCGFVYIAVRYKLLQRFFSDVLHAKKRLNLTWLGALASLLRFSLRCSFRLKTCCNLCRNSPGVLPLKV